MSEHNVRLDWSRITPDFQYETYSRDHRWTFPPGVAIEASAAPAYHGDAAKIDPEEAFVASVSSCHMLTFLAIAARKRYVVDSYVDDATGYLEQNAEGRLSIARVVLRPRIVFSGDKMPDAPTLERIHHQAHEECFIANSIRASVEIARE